MKRKHSKNSNGTTQEIPLSLAAYGEQFMSMFDDYDEQAAKQQRHTLQEQAGCDSEPSNEDSSEYGSPSDSKVGSQQGHMKDHKESKRSKAAKAAEAPLSKLDVFLSKRKGSLGSAAAAGPSNAQLQAQRKQQEQERLMERKLKKQFLSFKVSKIFDTVDASPLAAAEQEADNGLTAEEFAQIKRDVELLGASALDKQSAKAWRASMLARIGASADKAPRTGAKIGHGMAKKAKQREAAALQEAIAAGMVQAKGRGKKTRALKAKQRDKGLMEAGPGFKNGVLRLKKSLFKPKT